MKKIELMTKVHSEQSDKNEAKENNDQHQTDLVNLIKVHFF